MVDDDGRLMDRRTQALRQWTPEQGYTISSHCKPDGSGELKMVDDDGRTDGRTPALW